MIFPGRLLFCVLLAAAIPAGTSWAEEKPTKGPVRLETPEEKPSKGMPKPGISEVKPVKGPPKPGTFEGKPTNFINNGMEPQGKMQKQPGESAKIEKNKLGQLKWVEEVRPPRDFSGVSAQIDRSVDAALAKAAIPHSPQAEEAEFVRRVTLDLIGRVPTAEEAGIFLANTDPQKRARWIDALLASTTYGDHFATIWRELMLPRDNGVKGSGREDFTPWLSEQLGRNRGWDRIVTEMVTAEGKIRENPQSGFIMANTENGEPQPGLLADATGRLFWGLQLRCAECHDHPFAHWKQQDFWGVAAFFSKTRKGYADGKNPAGWTITEAPGDDGVRSETPPPAPLPPNVHGPAIVIPTIAGKKAGSVVKAKFLEGQEPAWTDDGPLRARFAHWAFSGENPWFAINTVNRLWSHFFTRGLVMPLDGFNDEVAPSHPDVLALLRKELVESGFDLKHVIRCVCNSRAYQRSSRAVAGNERDELWLSHHAVRVMRPEVLYASLSTVLQPVGRKGGPTSAPGFEKAQPLPGVPRDEFLRFFTSRPDENDGSLVNQGIPQFLRLMNSPLLNATGQTGARFAKMQIAPEGMTDALYLAAYARKPSVEERRLAEEFLAAPGDERDAVSGLLWILLNSSEFVTNH